VREIRNLNELLVQAALTIFTFACPIRPLNDRAFSRRIAAMTAALARLRKLAYRDARRRRDQ